MKIVITGALGHIGSFLIRQLPIDFPGLELIMVDNLITQRYCSLFNLPREAQYKFIESDIRSADLDKIIDGASVVIHLAAITDAAGSFEKAKFVEENNLNGTKKIAEACSRVGIKLISLSSTSIYGTQDKLVDEYCSKSNLKPQSPYAETKLLEENYLSEIKKNKGLDYTCLRFGTIYGVSPGIRFHTAVNKFCWQAVYRQPVTVWSTAYEQKRPYLALKDAARAISFVIDKNIFSGETYNILSGNFTVKEVVNAIKKLVPELRVQFVDSKIMNQLSYEVSREKIELCGFEFLENLEDGIKETINLLK